MKLWREEGGYSDLLKCKTPTGASCISTEGRFQDGWLHVIWKWNKSVCAWKYGIRVGGWGKVVFEVWADQTSIGITLDELWNRLLALMNQSLLFALFTILLMCGFQERLFDMSMLRCVAVGTALGFS